MEDHVSGFTLAEALLALAVLGILAALGIPLLSGARAATDAATAKAAFLTTVTDALRRASVKGTTVVVCPSPDGNGCLSTRDWGQGWIMFADLDGNRRFSEGDTVLSRQAALAATVALVGTRGRPRLVFQPGASAGGSNAHFVLCDERGAAKAISIMLANSGRIRSAPADASRAADCMTHLRP